VEKRSLIGMGAVLGCALRMAAMPDSIFSFVSDQEREMLTQQAEDPQMEAMVMSFAEELKSCAHRHVPCRCDAQLRLRGRRRCVGLLLRSKKIGKVVLLGGIGALILLDQWTVDKRYMNNEKRTWPLCALGG
jgi:hypothetical protein